MKRIFLIAAIVPCLTSGCSTQKLWDNGFVTCTTLTGAKETAGYCQPLATKDTNGGVVLEYDAVRYRLGMFGGVPARSKWKLQRMTNTVPISPLLATNAVVVSQWAICPAVGGEQDFVSSGQRLPLMYWESTNVGKRNRMVFPASECLLDFMGQWAWYMPPRQEGDAAKAVIVSKNTQEQSFAYLPVKLVMLPVTVCMDVITVIALPVILIIDYRELKDLH